MGEGIEFGLQLGGRGIAVHIEHGPQSLEFVAGRHGAVQDIEQYIIYIEVRLGETGFERHSLFEMRGGGPRRPSPFGPWQTAQCDRNVLAPAAHLPARRAGRVAHLAPFLRGHCGR